MAKVKVELNHAGVRELLLSDGVRDMLEEEAQRRCPEGCTVDVQPGRNRQVARIKTATRGAYYQNFKDNRLLKAIGGKK